MAAAGGLLAVAILDAGCSARFGAGDGATSVTESPAEVVDAARLLLDRGVLRPGGEADRRSRRHGHREDHPDRSSTSTRTGIVLTTRCVDGSGYCALGALVVESHAMGLLTFGLNVTLDGCIDHTQGIADDELHDYWTQLMDQSG